MQYKKRVYHNELLKMGLVPWTSTKTTMRRVKNDGFPGTWDGGRWCFNIDEVQAWFKKRETKKTA